MGRYLAMDYGRSRIGVALSDPLGLTAQAYPFVANDASVSAAIKKLIEEYDVTTIVLGLPKDFHGNDGPMATEVRAFAKSFLVPFGLPIQFVDERYSTQAAQRQLHEMGVNAKAQKALKDSQSAQYVLQGVLDSI
ncbi:MAG: Holliday junction resolvase RuvX [bacterium]|nr:Holliday junction resolvase RuvX [bacterium]